MSDEEHQKNISKIDQLIELATRDSTNENEAASAALQAVRLIKKNSFFISFQSTEFDPESFADENNSDFGDSGRETPKTEKKEKKKAKPAAKAASKPTSTPNGNGGYKNSKTFSIEDVEIVKETANAILVQQVNWEETMWIPKSQIDKSSPVKSEGDEGELIVSEWIAKQKGLVE